MIAASQKTFTTFDIKAKLGLTIDRLKDWMKNEFIEPSVQKAAGVGTKNLFSLFDLYLIKLFHHLVEVRGFSREKAKGIVDRVKHDKKIKNTQEHLLYRVLPQYIGFAGGDEGIRAFTGLDMVPVIFEDFKNIDILIINFRAIIEAVDNAIEG
jgi:hypothetical protein